MKVITDKEQFSSGAMRGVQDENTPRFDLIDGIFYVNLVNTLTSTKDYINFISFCMDLSQQYHNTLELHPGDIDTLYYGAADILNDLGDNHYHAWERLALLLAHGANKYSDRNWERGMPIKRTFASLCRHLFKYQHELETGEQIDNEDHGAAVLFNIMSILHTWRNYGNQFDVEA